MMNFLFIDHYILKKMQYVSIYIDMCSTIKKTLEIYEVTEKYNLKLYRSQVLHVNKIEHFKHRQNYKEFEIKISK